MFCPHPQPLIGLYRISARLNAAWGCLSDVEAERSRGVSVVVGRRRSEPENTVWPAQTRSRGGWASSAIVPSIQAGSRRTSTTASSSSRSSPTRYTDLCGIVWAELGGRNRTAWRRTREPFDPFDLFHQPFRRPSPVTTFRHGVAERYEVVIDYTSRAAMASTTTYRPAAAGRERESL